MEEFITGTNQRVFVHKENECSGNCPIHNPSDHHMNNWPLNWRQELGIFERICPCGVGHPDPDSLEYMKTINKNHAEGLSIHGCCGCCNESYFKTHKPENYI